MGNHECLLTDMTIAAPSDALSRTAAPDKWLVFPYEGEAIGGTMLYCPRGGLPPDVEIPLPALGLCRIYVGIYGCGGKPVWEHVLFAPPPGQGWQRGAQPLYRVDLRLSDEDYSESVSPDHFPDQPMFAFLSESLWKTADVTGRRLVISKSRQEALIDTTPCISHVRLVPVTEGEVWPPETKRLINYFDGNFLGHFVDSVERVKEELAPLARSDCEIALWNTCREDTCFYPSKIGCVLPWNETPGIYPHWMGRDLQRLLAQGLDPLELACTVAHEAGVKLFASYRRLTCRIPPFVLPLHSDAMLERRHDLWCMDENGEPVPQLSLAYPEVRQRMVALLAEQAVNYDIDGVHFFFARGYPFVLFEPPFTEAFEARHGEDPRRVACMDTRVWVLRAEFVLALFRELRQALDAVEERRGRRMAVAVTVVNRPRNCAFFGLDVEQLASERLVDILIPFPGHHIPRELGDRTVRPEFVVEFADAVAGTGVRLYPDCGYPYTDGPGAGAPFYSSEGVEHRAAAFYEAGAHGLQVRQGNVRGHIGKKREDWVHRRLGHWQELKKADAWREEAARPIPLRTVRGLRIVDGMYSVVTCG